MKDYMFNLGLCNSIALLLKMGSVIFRVLPFCLGLKEFHTLLPIGRSDWLEEIVLIKERSSATN